MRRQIALWIGWCATLTIAFAAAVFLMFRWFQPAVGHSWQKWAWVLCTTAALAGPVWWMLFAFIRPRLALFSVRGRTIWIAAAVLTGVLLVKLIPLSSMPDWNTVHSNEGLSTGQSSETIVYETTLAIRPSWKSLLFRACDVICLSFPLLVIGLWLATRARAR